MTLPSVALAKFQRGPVAKGNNCDVILQQRSGDVHHRVLGVGFHPQSLLAAAPAKLIVLKAVELLFGPLPRAHANVIG